MSLIYPLGPAGSVNLGSAAYTAQGVGFHNSPYLEGTASTPPTGATDGTSLLISCWYKALGDDTGFHIIFEQDSGGGNGCAIIRYNTGKVHIQGNNSSAVGVFVCQSSVLVTTATPGWHHVAFAYSNNVPKLYFDGVADAGATLTNVGGNINFTTATTMKVGSRGGFLNANGDVADLYIAFNQYLDISNSTHLEKFRSAGGAPVDLGSTGSIPTGTAPTMYFSSTVASWHVNKGTGGNLFTVQNGPLAAASTNPP